MENPFVVAATMARLKKATNAEYKPSWEVVGKIKINGDSFPVIRRVAKANKYVPHQGKKEMARRINHG